ncbi:MAG: ATP-binding cassette domain-containing protein [Nitrososphaerota archaeon]|nr:ATP-binding cassette domain-containing protein [Nitrososphaerota archaeon]MDG6968436.1 ATP-binding cassette domain-containing protein [Nitrososphaerota archaeon]MDG6975233.1 ATP-binding cassette domain-containing protein [Nitrososphaerota archaeon]MDG7009614.1 ATP-binding cassette domain-containing protein [Nitrososphaerota archaeon]MDG7027961.1 ATP-binding cassette domain-containing protein [Nitrososphaerota archaeon]
MSQQTIVKVEGLSRSFGSLKAVDGVSFEIYEGEIFGFLGPNGAGKTTTISMLTTLLRASGGTATVDGLDIHKHPNEVRRRVGVVPQEYTADEDLTGLQNIILCADLYGIPRSNSKPHAMELLRLVELEDAANRKVSTYSGGMRRRLELASGLINYPKLLFLDEPTLGLDVQTRAAVWKYIRMLKEDYRMTLFLTTHYLEEADSLCDRIAIVDHGHIIKIGTPSELKASIGGDVIVVGVAEAGPDISDDIKRMPLVKDVKKTDHEYRIKSEAGEESSIKVIDLIRSKGLHVTKISLTKPTLDEAYLEFTGRSIREEEAGKMDAFKQRVTMMRARR